MLSHCADVLSLEMVSRLLGKVIPKIGHPGPISVYVDIEDVVAYHGRVAAAGTKTIEPVWDAPWGLRQFSVLDPGGNLTTSCPG
jgi:uncharacterized glyoxalase superfamily protein PhnB